MIRFKLRNWKRETKKKKKGQGDKNQELLPNKSIYQI